MKLHFNLVSIYLVFSSLYICMLIVALTINFPGLFEIEIDIEKEAVLYNRLCFVC